MSTINLKQRKFLDVFLKTQNATKAAIAAGYSEKSARQIGARLLTNAAIHQEIERLSEKAAEKSELSAEYVLGNLKNVADRCMQAVPVMEKVDGQWQETGEFKFDSNGANKALELLGKYLKLWKEVGSTENPYSCDKISDDELEARLARLANK